MAKADRSATMSRLHSAARLSRTALAARLLSQGFYAGQDQIMLALDQEDGQTPGQLATRLGTRRVSHGSLRSRRQPLTMSYPSSSFATSAGISAGSSC